MDDDLRLLIVEDIPTDAELAKREIRRVFPGGEFLRVETRDDFLAALTSFKPDVILSDYKLPHFDGMSALKLALERAPETPLIMLTGSMNEDMAIECMKAGAWDYIIKEHIKRLGPAVKSGLEQKRARREQRLAEQALRESENRFKDVFESANVGKSITLPTGEINVNRAFCDLLGYSQEELENRKWQDLTPPDEIDLTQRFVDQLLKGEKDSVRFTKRYVHKNGSFVWADLSVAARRDNEGKLLHFITTIVDITDRKRAEEELRHSVMQYRSLTENSPDLIARFDRQYRHVYVNPAAAKAGRYTPEEYVGKTIEESGVPEHEARKWEDHIRSVFETGQTVAVEDAFETPNGIQYFNTKFVPEFAPDGSIRSVQSIARDITEHERAKKTLLALSSRQEAILAAVPDIIMEVDNNKVYSWANKAGLEFYGDDVIGREADFYFEGEQNTYQLVQPLFNGAEDVIYVESWQRRKDGEKRLLAWWCRVLKNESGNAIGALSSARDITAQRRMEDQLRQAQKMETVGQLAGGIAHDFNNMLQVITSYVEMSLAKVDAAQPLHQYLLEIRRAAQRSAEITGQLLAFARKQAVSPQLLDPNEAVAHTQKMIQRLIGEDIDLAWMPGHDPWKVKIDPAQLDQILANLAVYARDAIGGVGKLTIGTENVSLDEAYCAVHAGFLPGEYLLLAVSDDGRGMDKETMAHIFEPFFTTKGLDKGTGLGLATVYGIVKQNNGFINVYSEPGHGTSFKVYLPRAEGMDAAARQTAGPAAPRGGTETILVVEDEAAILMLAQESLEQLGYTVLTASTPDEALRMSEKRPEPIHLLITDVVMPQMNGRQLCERLCAARPGLKCLFMSGYTADVIAHRGVLEEGVSFIAKPFSLTALAGKVRELLDGNE